MLWMNLRIPNFESEDLDHWSYNSEIYMVFMWKLDFFRLLRCDLEDLKV